MGKEDKNGMCRGKLKWTEGWSWQEEGSIGANTLRVERVQAKQQKDL